jgi:hypothetical protein
MTTAGEGATSPTQCASPPGSYYLRGKAVACARGTYKDALGNKDCDKCPEGTSTPNGTVGALSKEECTVLLPGYGVAAGYTVGVTDAYACPQDTWRAGEVEGLATGGAAVACVPCGLNTVTLVNTTAATTPDACLAPPGYGWAASDSNAGGNSTICPLATYNPGYNRQPCAFCGGPGMTTLAPGALSADQCMTPAGYGNEVDPVTGIYSAQPCPIGTYGRPLASFGLVDVQCVKCPDHSTTLQNASSSQSQCLVDPG